MRKMPKNGKWDLGSFFYFFLPFWGHFFSISGRGPFSLFRPIFPIFGFRTIFHSIPGGLTRNHRNQFHLGMRVVRSQQSQSEVGSRARSELSGLSKPMVFLNLWFGKPMVWQTYGLANLCLDERQITHLICARLKYDLYDFFRGCFGAFIQEKEQEAGPKHP